MPMYKEVLLQWGPDRESSYIMRTFEQPRLQHALGEIYNRWTLISYGLLRHVDTPLRHLHERRCKDGCVWAYDRMHGERVRMCGYMPYTMREDLRAYDMAQRRRTYIGGSQTVSAEVARQHGFPDVHTG